MEEIIDYNPNIKIYNDEVSTVKFLNFGTPENLAVIYLKFKKRGKTKWNSKQ